MVIRRLMLATLAATAITSLAIVPAFASGVPTGPPSGGSQPTGGSSSGSSGGPKQGTVSHCSVYATASSFGLSCLGSGGSGDVTTVEDILKEAKPKPDPLPTCWDTVISDSDLQTIYEYTPNPLAPYYLHSCVTGLDPKRSPYSQPGLVLTQEVIEIPKGTPSCPKQPYTLAEKGLCVMTLTEHQQKIVDTVQSRGGQIPDTIVATYPSTRVRTGVPTAYVDQVPTDLVRRGDGKMGTADYPVGGVTMHAELASFAIEPYGPNSDESKTCDGTADVSPSDTPDTKPGACWWTYKNSSTGEPNQVYPFRADATWIVYVNGQAFATFHKYSDLQLPVFDVQTLVVN